MRVPLATVVVQQGLWRASKTVGMQSYSSLSKAYGSVAWGMGVFQLFTL
jgi:hypothetical protein